MLTSGINFKNFKLKSVNLKIKKELFSILNNKNEVLLSLGQNYKINFNLNKYKNLKNIRVIAMGGSTLGTQTIYDFLKHKIKKKFFFIDNLQNYKKKESKQKYLNLIVSKSGNTIETIVNSNILIRKQDKNIFITENKKNYLHDLAEKLKAEVIHHNNFIGGRYSVLSEVGMIPSELMGLNSKKFKQFNSLIKNKKFINCLVANVNASLSLIKKKKI